MCCSQSNQWVRLDGLISIPVFSTGERIGVGMGRDRLQTTFCWVRVLPVGKVESMSHHMMPDGTLLSEPQLLVQTAKFYKSPGEIVLLGASSEHSTILIVTADTLQFFDVETGQVSPVIERDSEDELDPWAISVDGAWVAVALPRVIKLMDMADGSFYKLATPAPVTALSFEGSANRLNVCTDSGDVFRHTVGEERKLRQCAKFPSFVGMQIGELVNIAHARSDSLTELFISTGLTEFSSSGEIVFEISPESLRKLALVASAFASVEQSAQLRMGFSETLGVVAIFADADGGSLVLGREGFLARSSEDGFVSETSIFMSGIPMQAVGSPMKNYLWIITDRDAQLLRTSTLEVVLTAHRPYPGEAENEDSSYLVEGYADDGLDEGDFLERGSQTPVAAFSESDRYLALGWEDGIVEVFNIQGDRPQKVLEQLCHPGCIESVAIIEIAEECFLVINGEDHKVSLWSLAGVRLPTSLGALSESVSTLTYLPASRRLVFGTLDGSITMSKYRWIQLVIPILEVPQAVPL